MNLDVIIKTNNVLELLSEQNYIR